MALRPYVRFALCAICATASVANSAECQPSSVNVKIQKESSINRPVGQRNYGDTSGYVIYEGSVYRNLIDIARLEGLAGIRPKLGHDIHLLKRYKTPERNLYSVISTLNQEIRGARFYVQNGLIVIDSTSSPLTSNSSKNAKGESCPQPELNSVVFKTLHGSLKDNIDKLARESGWTFIWDSQAMDSNRLVKSQVIEGDSYYLVLGELLRGTGISASFE